MDTCGIPNEANYHVRVIIGRDGEASYSDIYVCNEHVPADLADRANQGNWTVYDYGNDWDEVTKPVRSLFRFDNADEWEVLEFRVSHLR